MQHMDLETFANGALTMQVNRAMEEVTKNIQDPNTNAEATRKIIVTIAFKPNEARDFVTTGIVTKTTIAPSTGVITAIAMGKNVKTGEVEAVEVGKGFPGQLSFVEQKEDGESEIEKAYDQSTGEIYETPVRNNIVDLRKVK